MSVMIKELIIIKKISNDNDNENDNLSNVNFCFIYFSFNEKVLSI